MSSTWFATQGFGIRESVERCFALGFGLVEVGAGHRYEPDAVETVLALKRENPAKRFTLHALFPQLAPRLRKTYTMNMSDVKEHAKILEVAAVMFDISKRIGAGVVGMHGGYEGEVVWVPGSGGFERLEIRKPIPPEVAEENMMSVLRKLARLAEDRGVKLAIEISDSSKPVPSGAEAFEKIFSEIGSKSLGMLLDLGHLHKVAATKGFDPYEFTARFKDKILEMHLHDVVNGQDHRAVGTGVVDFRRHFEIMGRDRLESIPLVFEYTNLVDEAAALRGKEIIEKIIGSL